MQTRAAILWEVGADWSVEDIELDVHVQPGRTITLNQEMRQRP